MSFISAESLIVYKSNELVYAAKIQLKIMEMFGSFIGTCVPQRVVMFPAIIHSKRN